MKKLLIGILCLLLCTGCTSKSSKKETKSSQDISSTDSLDDSFYPIVNLGTNLIRETFYQDFSSSDDFQTIGRELQVLSTEYFSTSDYYMSEGLQLVKKDKDELLLRNKKHSLQPATGETVDGKEVSKMVENISEQDYYEKSGDKYTLKGMAIAIILDATGGTNDVLSDDSVNNYGKEVISKLYNYLQTKKSVKDIPTLIAVYRKNVKDENSYNGHYIYSSYCKNGKVGSIKLLDYNTYIFTSDEANKADESLYSQFSVFKNNVKNASTEAVGVVGYGKYKDGSIQTMKIQVKVSVKSYTELIYMVETVADEMDSHFSGVDTYAIINDQDGLKAVVIKNAGEDAQSTLLY